MDRKQKVLNILVVLGFTFNLNGDNPLLFSRAHAAAQLLKNVSPSELPNTVLLLSGRGLIRKEFEEMDTLKLANGFYESKILSEKIKEEAPEQYGQLLKVILDTASTTTLENGIFCMNELDKYLTGSAISGAHARLTVVTSDFHAVRAHFLFHVMYKIFKAKGKLAGLEIDNLATLDFTTLFPPKLEATMQHSIFADNEMTVQAAPSKKQYSYKIKPRPIKEASFDNTIVGFSAEKYEGSYWELISFNYNVKTAGQARKTMNDDWDQFCALRGLKEHDETLKETLQWALDGFKKKAEELEESKIDHLLRVI